MAIPTFFNIAIATIRWNRIQSAPNQIQVEAAVSSHHFKRSDTDPNKCESPSKSPDKKKMKPCSQDPETVEKISENCIVHVMKDKRIEAQPPLTNCGEGGTHEGNLLSLTDFDNFDDEESSNEYMADAFAVGTESNADLIMSRAGFFSADTHNLKETKICQKHADAFGKDFVDSLIGNKGYLRTSKRGKWIFKCIFPDTDLLPSHKEVTLVQRNTIITKIQSEAIFRMTGKLVPVGLPVCKVHKGIADAYVEMYNKQRKSVQSDERASGYSLRERSAVCLQEESSSQPLFCSQTPPGSQGLNEPDTCPLPETPLERFRRLMLLFKDEDLVLNWHYTDKYNILSMRSKRRYKAASKSAQSIINYALVGDEQNAFEKIERWKNKKFGIKVKNRLQEF